MMRSTSSWASRSWMTSVLSRRLARSMCRRKLSSCAARPVLARTEVVEPGLPHRAHLVVGAGQALDLGQRGVEVAGGSQPGRLVGVEGDARDELRRARRPRRRPTARRAGRSRSARCGYVDRRRRGDGRRASSTQSPSAMSRWQWLSTTGCGSGSGAGGRSRSRRGPGRPPRWRRGCGSARSRVELSELRPSVGSQALCSRTGLLTAARIEVSGGRRRRPRAWGAPPLATSAMASLRVEPAASSSAATAARSESGSVSTAGPPLGALRPRSSPRRGLPSAAQVARSASGPRRTSS